MKAQTGTLIVLSGPSGVGKGVLCRQIMVELPWLRESVSVTTREKRPGEQEGIDYVFVSKPQFQKMIENHKLVEWAEFAGHYYGTPKQYIAEALEQGHSMLFEIDVQGALNLKKLFPQAHLIFIAPPSIAVLEERLRKRNTNDETDIQTRLKTAVTEMAQKDQFEAVLVNDDLKTCENALLALIQSWISYAPDPKTSTISP